MKWKNVSFSDTAYIERARAELNDARIKTGEVFMIDDIYYLPYLPIGREQVETAERIVIEIIEDYMNEV